MLGLKTRAFKVMLLCFKILSTLGLQLNLEEVQDAISIDVRSILREESGNGDDPGGHGVCLGTLVG